MNTTTMAAMAPVLTTTAATTTTTSPAMMMTQTPLPSAVSSNTLWGVVVLAVVSGIGVMSIVAFVGEIQERQKHVSLWSEKDASQAQLVVAELQDLTTTTATPTTETLREFQTKLSNYSRQFLTERTHVDVAQLELALRDRIHVSPQPPKSTPPPQPSAPPAPLETSITSTPPQRSRPPFSSTFSSRPPPLKK